MKHYADMKRRPYEFSVGDWVWLKLHPYRKHSVEFWHWKKPSIRFYGLFQVEKKIGSVAYKLSLPLGRDISATHPVTIHPLTMDAHPVDIPSEILAYQRSIHKGRVFEQVLVDWQGLGPDHRSWQDLKSIA